MRQLKFKFLNVIIIAIASSIILHLNLYAQDIHFSQLHSVPVFLNPANTGILNHDFRVCNNYRNQWSKIDFPYHTYYLSVDGSVSAIPLYKASIPIRMRFVEGEPVSVSDLLDLKRK